jgi:hypothetical protein
MQRIHACPEGITRSATRSTPCSALRARRPLALQVGRTLVALGEDTDRFEFILTDQEAEWEEA